jgi:hypothetical protein
MTTQHTSQAITTAPDALLTAYRRHFAADPVTATTGPGGSVWVAAAPNDSAIVNLVVPALEAHLAFRLSQPGTPNHRHDVIGMPLPPWALYIGAVGWAWAARGYTVPGVDAVLHPANGVQEGFVWESGLAFAAAWQDIGGWPLPEGGLLGLMTRLGGYFR